MAKNNNSQKREDKIEVEAYLKEEQTVFDCVYNVLCECIDKYFVVCNEEIIGIVAHKPVTQEGHKIALLCVLTTNVVKKYPKQYYIASKKFISSLIASYDMLVCEILNTYDATLKMASKLGFQKALEYERKGIKFIVEVLRISHGLD